MALGGGEGETKDGTLHLTVPPRCAKSAESGHNVDATVVRHAGGKGLHVLWLVHELQLVAHPLQRCSGAVDVALEAIPCLSKGREAHAGDQSLGGRQRLLADVHHHAAARAVGHLARTGLEAHLTDKGTVRVAQDASDGDALREEPLDGRSAIDSIAGSDLRQHRAGNVEEPQEVIVPLHGVYVEKHGTRGIGGVGGMDLALGELPDKPGVDGTHEQQPLLSLLARTGDIVEQPCYARSREVGVDEQT